MPFALTNFLSKSIFRCSFMITTSVKLYLGVETSLLSKSEHFRVAAGTIYQLRPKTPMKLGGHECFCVWWRTGCDFPFCCWSCGEKGIGHELLQFWQKLCNWVPAAWWFFGMLFWRGWFYFPFSAAFRLKPSSSILSYANFEEMVVLLKFDFW